jgi:hypothetical protein
VAVNTTLLVLPELELLLSVSFPLTAPATVGWNLIVTVAVLPGFNVTGKLPVTTEKPVPVTVPDETVTADVPVDDNVTDSVVEDPTATVPKLRLVALTASFGLAAAVPVPLSVTAAVVPVDELLPIVSLPVTAPAVLGAKSIWSVSD